MRKNGQICRLPLNKVLNNKKSVKTNNKSCLYYNSKTSNAIVVYLCIVYGYKRGLHLKSANGHGHSNLYKEDLECQDFMAIII